jgi:methyl-accepting chemotaxis protein
MNNEERKHLNAILETIQGAMEELGEMKDDIQQKAENVAEYFPDSERAQKLEEEAERLDEAFNQLEEACGAIEEVSQ